MYLSLDLVDREQTVLTRLDNRQPGSTIEIGLNASRRGRCPLALDDPAFAVAEPMDTYLRVILKGDDLDEDLPLLIARVVTPEDLSQAEKPSLTLAAIDQFLQVEDTLARSVTGTEWDPVVFAATDQSQIMWDLVALGTGTGIVAGSLPASVNRDRTYPPGKEVGAALVEMSEVIGGPDFELEPVIATDGTVARFNTFYPQQGTDLSATLRFRHGGGEGEDAPGFSFAPTGEGMCNRVLVIGAPVNAEGEGGPFAFHHGYVAEDAVSIAQYGAFEKQEQVEDVTEAATLQSHAEAIVAACAYPTPYFDFTAAPEKVDGEDGIGIPPIFGKDYWLGDTVGVDAYLNGADPRKGDAVTRAVSGRITDVTITELASGQIQVKSSCAPVISAAGVTGHAVTVKVPNSEGE